MSASEQFNPDDNDTFTFSDARDLESPTQRLVREVFEETETANRLTLHDFNPHNPEERAEIALVTYFPEAEAAEPQIAESKRRLMLQNLGLQFQHLPSDHPDLLFQHTYRGGAVNQIRLRTRSDGVEVPVFTALGSTEDNHPVERMRLLSYTEAEAFTSRLEDNLDDQKLTTRLKNEIGLDDTMLQLANLSFEDKRSMLAAYDEIQSLDTIRPDTETLNRVRKNLVKTMLPGNKLMSFVRGNKLEKVQALYEDSMSGLVKRCGLDAKATNELLESERLQRLQSLNEQLRFRRLTAKIGLIAMTGLVTAVGTSTGGASGVLVATEAHEDPIKGAVIGALIGGGSGLWVGLEKAIHQRRRTKLISGFSTAYFTRSSALHRQLRDEQKLANDYISLLEN